ncbi:nitronate monooxygenase family protein [Mycobacterium xenopi 3993]|nr:nitronate monooxygenase family protein [Mycobacterium xenopi 3993]
MGADGLIAQGREAGGHLVGTQPALDFLPQALSLAGPRPVFLAGGSPPAPIPAPRSRVAPAASSPERGS